MHSRFSGPFISSGSNLIAGFTGFFYCTPNFMITFVDCISFKWLSINVLTRGLTSNSAIKVKLAIRIAIKVIIGNQGTTKLSQTPFSARSRSQSVKLVLSSVCSLSCFLFYSSYLAFFSMMFFQSLLSLVLLPQVLIQRI